MCVLLGSFLRILPRILEHNMHTTFILSWVVEYYLLIGHIHLLEIILWFWISKMDGSSQGHVQGRMVIHTLLHFSSAGKITIPLLLQIKEEKPLLQ